MKKTLAAIAAGALLSIGGFASAAEPMQLTDNQMDTISAGQSSWASSGGHAIFGVVATGADSSSASYFHGAVKVTNASTATIALGFGVGAGASAGSHL